MFIFGLGARRDGEVRYGKNRRDETGKEGSSLDMLGRQG